MRAQGRGWERGYPGLTTPPAGVPPWTLSEGYDLTATASLGAPPTAEERALMMRALLVDRFGLVAHMEQTEQDVLALVPARSDGRLGPDAAVPEPRVTPPARFSENPG